jgi:hypothetical protein
MPSKKGLSFSLTFFVMFCHAHIIGSQDADFNKKVEVASRTINQPIRNYMDGPDRTFVSSAANGVCGWPLHSKTF